VGSSDSLFSPCCPPPFFCIIGSSLLCAEYASPCRAQWQVDRRDSKIPSPPLILFPWETFFLSFFSCPRRVASAVPDRRKMFRRTKQGLLVSPTLFLTTPPLKVWIPRSFHPAGVTFLKIALRLRRTGLCKVDRNLSPPFLM